jgi:hypothetical protein
VLGAPPWRRKANAQTSDARRMAAIMDRFLMIVLTLTPTPTNAQ